jgi:aspartyl-tRNA(Asn)/glutamyl-tRNA(Gln) amidotransferase subunit A
MVVMGVASLAFADVRTTREIAAAVRAREVSATELVDEALAAIDRLDGPLNAFLFVDADGARAAAGDVDRRIAAGDDPGPLAGVPFGVKDLQHAAGMPTTHGSVLYKDGTLQPRDSVQVARLRAAGAVPIGKTTASEFGAVAYTNTKAWGVTRNPWDPSKTSGSSSGGSATAVAAGMVPFATASDGGGSIRIPAAFSGLPGLKPSFGRVPNPHRKSSHTGCWGTLTTDVADQALLLDVCAGPDDRDRTSLPAPAGSFADAAERLDVRGLRATWSRDFGYAPAVDPEVEDAAFAAAEALCDAAGLELVERPLRFTDPVKLWLGSGTLDIWEMVDKRWWPDRKDDFTRDLQFMLGASEKVTAAQYARMMQRRLRFEHEMAEVYDDVDLILSPTTAIPAFAAEGPMPRRIGEVELETPALCVPFTMPANLCWNPAASVPCGRSSTGLPLGLQIMGRRHADDVVLRLMRIFEEARPWPRLAPAPQG